MIDHSRKCEVCGAAVRNMNPKTKTCDPICTRARNNNITRAEQIVRDIQQEEAEERELWRK
jgi:hypothetical protein